MAVIHGKDMRLLRWILLRIKKSLTHWTETKKAADASRPVDRDYAYLIELGYLHRKRLLRDPRITKVDVALAGRHLVIVAYKENASS